MGWAECGRQEIIGMTCIPAYQKYSEIFRASPYFILIYCHQVTWRHMMSLGWIPKCFQAFPCDLAPGFVSLELKSHEAHWFVFHWFLHSMHCMLLYWSSILARQLLMCFLQQTTASALTEELCEERHVSCRHGVSLRSPRGDEGRQIQWANAKAKPWWSVKPRQVTFNSEGFPMRPWASICPYYMSTSQNIPGEERGEEHDTKNFSQKKTTDCVSIHPMLWYALMQFLNVFNTFFELDSFMLAC